VKTVARTLAENFTEANLSAQALRSVAEVPWVSSEAAAARRVVLEELADLLGVRRAC
jgi:hypothetical protein